MTENKIVEAMTDVLAIAKGEKAAYAITHNGHRYISKEHILDLVRGEEAREIVRAALMNYKAPIGETRVCPPVRQAEHMTEAALSAIAELIERS